MTKRNRRGRAAPIFEQEPAEAPEAAPAPAPEAPAPELEAVAPALPPPLEVPPEGAAGGEPSPAGATLHGVVEENPAPVDERAFEAAAEALPGPAERVELLPEPPRAEPHAEPARERPAPRAPGGRITREERAAYALRYGPMADALLTKGAAMVGSGLTSDAIIRSNHATMNQARAAAGLAPSDVVLGVPVDIDISALMNGTPPDRAVTRTLLVVSSPVLDATGAQVIGPRGPRWELAGVYPGDEEPVMRPGQQVKSVPITSGMAVVYHLAAAPRAYEGKVKRFLLEHEDAIRAVAAAATVGLHGYAVYKERGYRLQVRAEERARAQREAQAHRDAAAANAARVDTPAAPTAAPTGGE